MIQTAARWSARSRRVEQRAEKARNVAAAWTHDGTLLWVGSEEDLIGR
jgi:hypothetical protein